MLKIIKETKTDQTISEFLYTYDPIHWALFNLGIFNEISNTYNYYRGIMVIIIYTK